MNATTSPYLTNLALVSAHEPATYSGFNNSSSVGDADDDVSALPKTYHHKDYDFLAHLAEPKSSQITLIVLYTVTVLVVVSGNVLALVVLVLGNRSKTDLTKYLINLTVSDLCMGIFCMPFTFTETMLGRWIFSSPMCPLVLFMQMTSVAVSIYTNVAIGIDRYLAVVMPLKQRVTKTRTRLVICAIWVMSIALGAVQLVVARTRVHKFGSATYLSCGELWNTYAERNIYNFCIFAFTYVIPLCLLCWTYIWIGQVLWSRQTPGNADAIRDRVQIESRRKVTKMLVVIVLMFAVCWLPLNLYIIIIDLMPSLASTYIKDRRDEMIFLGLFYACHWLAMANSFSNPVIYCFLNGSFRADLRYLATHMCKKHQPIPRRSSQRRSSQSTSVGRRFGSKLRAVRTFLSRTRSRHGSTSERDDARRESNKRTPEKKACDPPNPEYEIKYLLNQPQAVELIVHIEGQR